MSISYNVTPEGVAMMEAVRHFGEQHLVVSVVIVALAFLVFLYFFFKYYYGWDYL